MTTETGKVRTVLAWGVHLYTALGAPLGMLALVAAFAGDFRRTFILLAITVCIDASDGALARRLDVKRVVPGVDGALLDCLVDYLNFVVVPVAVFMQPGILPEFAQPAALLVLLASAYGFAQTEAKGTIEPYFRGFPSYWNVVALYFVVLETSAAFNLTVILILVVLVFVPIRWLYPSRMETMRAFTITLGLVWGAVVAVLIARLPEPSPRLGLISLFFPVYYTVASLVYHFRD